jgi:cation transport regulator ChaC
MSTNEKKGITVKIDAELHAQVREYLEKHEMTMAEFVTLALQDELHPKHNITEEKNMGNMRTLAFQVPEELFQQIKDYLQRNNMTQKDFVIGLIEAEIERDLTQRQAVSETPIDSEEMAEEQTDARETAAVSDCE